VTRKTSLTDDPDELQTFRQMAREFPVRTIIYAVGLPAFALLQLVNAYLFEGSLLIIGVFATLMILCSIALTRYHVAIYRRRQIERQVAANS
jgi:hypothetical protein